MNKICFLTAQAGGLVLALLIFFAPIALAGDSALDDLLTDIKAHSASLQAISCDFTQTRTLALFNKPIIFQGRLAVIRPDKLRWEFLSPVPSVLIFNADTGMRCNAKGESTRFDLTSDPIMKMVAEQLWTWLDGDYFKLKTNYSLQQTAESAILVTPLDRQTADIIQDISIVFDADNRQPQNVTINEPGGDTTSIVFSSYQLNPPLQQTTFSECSLRD